LLKHGDALDDISQRDVLGRGDDHHPCERQRLGQAETGVAGPWGQIHTM
jgi:hypothetical protein